MEMCLLNRGDGAVGKSVGPATEGWVFESQPRRTVKTGNDSSTTKRWATSTSVTGSR